MTIVTPESNQRPMIGVTYHPNLILLHGPSPATVNPHLMSWTGSGNFRESSKVKPIHHRLIDINELNSHSSSTFLDDQFCVSNMANCSQNVLSHSIWNLRVNLGSLPFISFQKFLWISFNSPFTSISASSFDPFQFNSTICQGRLKGPNP